MRSTVAPYRAAGSIGSQQRFVLMESGTGGVDRRGALAEMTIHSPCALCVRECVCVCVVGHRDLQSEQTTHDSPRYVHTMLLARKWVKGADRLGKRRGVGMQTHNYPNRQIRTMLDAAYAACIHVQARRG